MTRPNFRVCRWIAAATSFATVFGIPIGIGQPRNAIISLHVHYAAKQPARQAIARISTGGLSPGCTKDLSHTAFAVAGTAQGFPTVALFIA